MADTMREKLIELQKESVKNCVPGETCVNCRYIAQTDCMERLTADYMVANGVTVQKWIPVSERLPEENTAVLTYRESGINVEFRWHRGWDNDEFTPCPVTHWMPLPTPPKEE